VGTVVPITAREARSSATTACVVAIVGFLCPIPEAIALYKTPTGTDCRPMGVAVVFLVGLVTPLVVRPFVLEAFRQRGVCRVLGAVAIFLSVLPLPVYLFLFHWIITAHSLRTMP